MKKLLLLAALLALPSMVFAQGFVNFQNTTTPDTRINTNINGQIGPMSGTASWIVGLYMAPAGTTAPANGFSSLDPAWSLVVTSTNRTGGFSGLFTAYNPLQLPGQYSVGTTYATLVRAWDAATTTTYRGQSIVGSVTPVAAAPFPAIMGTGAGQITGFQIVGVVPEPSSIALGLLGLGAVTLFRRKK